MKSEVYILFCLMQLATVWDILDNNNKKSHFLMRCVMLLLLTNHFLQLLDH
jgi:hypothetical protein